MRLELAKAQNHRFIPGNIDLNHTKAIIIEIINVHAAIMPHSLMVVMEYMESIHTSPIALIITYMSPENKLLLLTLNLTIIL